MPARFSSTDLRSFFYGGFDTFRWDLLGFGFCRVWMSFCLFFASASTALFAGAKSNESFLLLTATTFMVLFFIIFRKTLKGEKARGLIIRFTILTGIIGCCCSLLDLWLGSPILVTRKTKRNAAKVNATLRFILRILFKTVAVTFARRRF